MPRIHAAVLAVLALAACSPTSNWRVMRAIRTQFAGQYHQCVPLGWNPVPIYGTYYPGYDVELEESDWWLPPIWLGYVPQSVASDPRARNARMLLSALVKARIVQASAAGGDTYYHLTDSGYPYFFDDDAFGNNPGHAPYLCYSKIVPQRIVWRQPIHLERGIPVFRAAVAWTASPAAAWASDPTIRRRSVTLAPTSSPVIVKFARTADGWTMQNLYPSRPDVVADPAVWSR